MPNGSAGGTDGPNWLVIGIFTVLGIIMLSIAYWASSYWQGVLVNGGTALLLFAMLVFSEPKLVRHLDKPRDLNEAQARFRRLAAPFMLGEAEGSTLVKGRVLKAVASSGLHQHPPHPSSVRFTSLNATTDLEWLIDWDDKGLRHHVKVGGTGISRGLDRCINWNEGIVAHEEYVYKILCQLLHELKPATGSARPVRRPPH